MLAFNPKRLNLCEPKPTPVSQLSLHRQLPGHHRSSTYMLSMVSVTILCPITLSVINDFSGLEVAFWVPLFIRPARSRRINWNLRDLLERIGILADQRTKDRSVSSLYRLRHNSLHKEHVCVAPAGVPLEGIQRDDKTYGPWLRYVSLAQPPRDKKIKGPEDILETSHN